MGSFSKFLYGTIDQFFSDREVQRNIRKYGGITVIPNDGFIDATPTAGSNDAVSSNGVYVALSGKAPLSAVKQHTSEYFTSDGSSDITLSHNYISGSLGVYINGVRVSPSLISETGANILTLFSSPFEGDEIIVDYQY